MNLCKHGKAIKKAGFVLLLVAFLFASFAATTLTDTLLSMIGMVITLNAFFNSEMTEK